MSTSDEIEMEEVEKVEILVNQAADHMTMVHDDWTSHEIILLSEKELEERADLHGLENDEQTRCFIKLIATSTNFASSNFIQRIQLIPTLVKNIQDLLDKMRLEVKEFAEAANEFETLIHFFCNLVIETRHNIGLVLPHMKATEGSLGVIADVLEPRDNEPLSDIDKNDISISVHGLATQMKKMLELSRENSFKSRELNERIATLKKDVKVKGEIAKHRISFANTLRFLLPLGTSTASAGAVGATVGSVNFGGIGTLVIAVATLNPVVAVILAGVIGGLGVIAIVSLIHRFWIKRKHKAVRFLQEICIQLVELYNANIYFLQCLHENEEAINAMIVKLDQIISLITIDSARIRRQNAKVCQGAIESIQQTMECIEKIKKFDISRWINPMNLVQDSHHRLSLPASKDQ